MSPMTLQAVPVRIPTEREAADDVEVSNGGLPTIPAEAKMLPRPPLHRMTTAGGASHLGIPADAAEDIDVGDLIAAPDHVGQPWAVYEVVEHVGLWAETFPLPDDTDDEYAGWAHLTATPARDRLTIASEAARRATDYADMNRAAENARVQREMGRKAAECAGIVEKLRSVGPDHAARAVQHVLDDDGRRALLDALARVEREAAEREAPVAA